MAEDYVGLNLGNLGDAGKEDAAACPDCGGPMEHVPFRIECDDEDVAMRVFAAYLATLNIPVEMLFAVVQQHAHFHIVGGSAGDCQHTSHKQ